LRGHAVHHRAEGRHVELGDLGGRSGILDVQHVDAFAEGIDDEEPLRGRFMRDDLGGAAVVRRPVRMRADGREADVERRG